MKALQEVILRPLCRVFCSSRRRHTRLQGDWSSDVCSSDLGIPALSSEFPSLTAPDQNETLDPDLALRLYGPELEVAVSSLERFASCPFQFFMRHGLRVQERDEFRLDIREQGSFQHEILATFHQELAAEGLKWRHLTSPQARERIGKIADRLTASFKDG